MLCQTKRRAKARPVWVWIGMKSDRLFTTYRRRGVKVLEGPRNCSWAYEIVFADPDGNALWLGTDPRRDRPFEDEKS